MGLNLGIEMVFFSWSHGHDLHSRKINKWISKYINQTDWISTWGDSLCIWIESETCLKSQEKIYQAEALLGCLLNLPTVTGFPSKCRILMIRLLWWWLIEQWDKNIYFEWDTSDFISFLLDNQSFRVLSISLVLCTYSWQLFYCIGCYCTLIGASS